MDCDCNGSLIFQWLQCHFCVLFSLGATGAPPGLCGCGLWGQQGFLDYMGRVYLDPVMV